jgi:hypothetical protein
MGCKSCGELAMARNTSDIAACRATSSLTCSCSSARDGERLGDVGLSAGLFVRAGCFIGRDPLSQTLAYVLWAQLRAFYSDRPNSHSSTETDAKVTARSGPVRNGSKGDLADPSGFGPLYPRNRTSWVRLKSATDRLVSLFALVVGLPKVTMLANRSTARPAPPSRRRWILAT